MFRFLKKLFSSKEEVRKDSIKVGELEEWFKGKVDKILSNLEGNIKEIKTNLQQEMHKTKDNLAILTTAKLHNPNISVREKQFMEGNRRAYILAVNRFLRDIELDKDYPELLEFCTSFNIRLASFGKSTIRSYQILQEFFANESKNIAVSIKKLETLIHNLKTSITNARLDKINEIKSAISDLHNKIKQKGEYENILRDKEKIKEGLIKNKSKTEKEIENLKSSKEYKQLNELKANKEVLLSSIRDHNAKLIHAFSVIQRPLKKLLRVVLEDSELLEKYIENPVEALLTDNNLKIKGLLKKLENNINNYTLDLKDKKREKVLETIKGLTREFFTDFINKHVELNEKLENLQRKINENEALKKEEKLDYELSNVKDNLEKVDSEIKLNEKEIGKINLEQIKSNLGREINNLLKVEVVIG